MQYKQRHRYRRSRLIWTLIAGVVTGSHLVTESPLLAKERIQITDRPGRTIATSEALELATTQRRPPAMVEDASDAAKEPSLKLAEAKYPMPKPLNFQINYVYRSGGGGPLKPLVDGAELQTGDHYKIQFTPEESAYVYIFQLDSSGAMYQLFPMTSFKGVVVSNHNPVEAANTYSLPAKDKYFKLDDWQGSESIFFLAFRRPNVTLEKRYARLLKARAERNKNNMMDLQVKIVQEFRTRGPAHIVADPNHRTTTVIWSNDEKFHIPVQRLDSLCTECVSRVTFEHR